MNYCGWEDSLSPTRLSTNTRTTCIANNSRNCFILQSWQNLLIPPKYDVDMHKMNVKMPSIAIEMENDNGKVFEISREKAHVMPLNLIMMKT